MLEAFGCGGDKGSQSREHRIALALFTLLYPLTYLVARAISQVGSEI
jgi:hypothetical protein